jgi:predicted deacylase
MEVAELLLGKTVLQEHKPGILKVTTAPAGTVAFFFVDKGIARGLYITSATHGQEALSATALQQLAKNLTGHEFAAKDLTVPRSGAAYVSVRLGKYPALLGWHKDELVEASIGKVEP